MEATINGQTIEVPNNLRNVPLLDFIRDYVGLKGTKFGCGIGLCGACTVHIDGVATRSCQVAADQVAGRRVTTIEGLAGTTATGALHPVQRAWIEESVPQCGYCQAGQIMTAAALLKRNPDPSDEDVQTGMSGNICRCGTYPRIRRAVARAAREGHNADRS